MKKHKEHKMSNGLKTLVKDTIAGIADGRITGFQEWVDSLTDFQVTSLYEAVEKDVIEAKEAVVTLACHFAVLETGREEFSEDEAIGFANHFFLNLSVVAGVRDGTMELKGTLKVASDGDAQFKITEKGRRFVEGMMLGKEKDGRN